MTNLKIMPNEKTMDYFLFGFLFEGRGESGMSMIQSCFTMYGVRPSQEAFMKMVKKFVKINQVHEIRRAAVVFKQLWPSDEEHFWDEMNAQGIRR